MTGQTHVVVKHTVANRQRHCIKQINEVYASNSHRTNRHHCLSSELCDRNIVQDWCRINICCACKHSFFSALFFYPPYTLSNIKYCDILYYFLVKEEEYGVKGISRVITNNINLPLKRLPQVSKIICFYS